MKRLFSPVVVWFSTERCFAGCKHCCYPPVYGRDLGTDEAKELISRVASFGAKYFIFSGGEPLLREDIVELVSYASSKGLKVFVATKGFGLDGERGEKLIHSLAKAGAEIDVAIDALDPDIYTDITGNRGVFEWVWRAIELGKKYGVLSGLTSATLRFNLWEIPKVLDLGQRLGTVNAVLGIRPVGRASKSFWSLAPDPQELEKFFRFIAFEASRGRWKQYIHVYEPIFMRVLRQSLGNSIPRNIETARPCLIGLYLDIDSRGYAMPCLFAPIRFKNVLDEPIEEVYADMVEKTKDLRDPEKLRGRCGECEYKYICGGCRVRAYMLTGDWFAEDPLCAYKPQTRK